MKKKANPQAIKPKPWGARLAAALGWSLFIALILYGAALLLSRTAGFGSLLADRLSSAIGIPLRVGNARLDPRLNLTLRNISTLPDSPADSPAFTAAVIRLTWSFRDFPQPCLESLALESAHIRFVQNADGQWLPAPLAPLAEKISQMGRLGGLQSLSVASAKTPASATNEAPSTPAPAEPDSPEPLLGGIALDLRQCAVSWHSGGREVAAFDQITFLSRTVAFPGRDVQYYNAAIGTARLGQGRTLENINFEVLSSKGRHFILGPRMTRPATTPAAQPPAVAKTTPPSGDAATDREAALLAEAEALLARKPVPPPPPPPSPSAAAPIAHRATSHRLGTAIRPRGRCNRLHTPHEPNPALPRLPSRNTRLPRPPCLLHVLRRIDRN